MDAKRETVMSKKLFVGGLAWATTSESLRKAFEVYGDVAEAKVITDRETGRSRGFGFVTMTNAADADAAITAMDGKELDGRAVRVNEASPSNKSGGRRPNRRDS
jgi:RNA recognition motif-containing protein